MHTPDTALHASNTTDQVLYRNRHLKEAQVCELRSIRRTKLWNDVRAGLFPAPIKISPCCTRWVAADVLAWLEDPVGWVARAKNATADNAASK